MHLGDYSMYRIEKWGALWKVYPPVDKIGPAVKFKTEEEAEAYVASMTGTSTRESWPRIWCC